MAIEYSYSFLACDSRAFTFTMVKIIKVGVLTDLIFY